MAITIEGQAENFTPAFNQVNFYFDSTNKNKKGFRYVIDVYQYLTATKIYENRIAPRVGDGFAVLQLQKILSSLVSFDMQFIDLQNASNSYYSTTIKIGEEYVEEWNYNDYQERATGSFAGYTEIFQTPTVDTHNFVVGDRINIAQTDGGVIKPMLEGLFTIVEIVSGYSIVIDILWSEVGAGADMGGVITYSDNRKITTRDLETVVTTVWNGALPFIDFVGFPASGSYQLTTAPNTTGKALTVIPDSSFTITPSEDLFINFGNFYDDKIAWTYFENDEGDIFRKATIADTDFAVLQVMAGANNHGATLVSGTSPLVKTTTLYYDVWVTDSVGLQMSKKYRINIDQRCKISDAKILYMDRMGSFLSCAFQLRENERGNVTKESYRKSLGDLNTTTNRFEYKSYDAGTVMLNANVQKEFTLRTNWMNETMTALFEQLLSSPVCYLMLDGVNYQRIEIVTTDFENEKEVNKKMIRKTITVRLANQDAINI